MNTLSLGWCTLTCFVLHQESIYKRSVIELLLSASASFPIICSDMLFEQSLPFFNQENSHWIIPFFGFANQLELHFCSYKAGVIDVEHVFRIADSLELPVYWFAHCHGCWFRLKPKQYLLGKYTDGCQPKKCECTGECLANLATFAIHKARKTLHIVRKPNSNMLKCIFCSFSLCFFSPSSSLCHPLHLSQACHSSSACATRCIWTINKFIVIVDGCHKVKLECIKSKVAGLLKITSIQRHSTWTL